MQKLSIDLCLLLLMRCYCLQYFPHHLGFNTMTPTTMTYDNQVVIFIYVNLVVDEQTKDIEIECHFIHVTKY